ncbi:MAG: homoserine dehydrogenase, partial [Pseudomonadota bacterium]
MTSPLRVGVIGLGTVGGGVVRLVEAHGALLASRAGRPIEIVAVSARSRDKNRDFDVSAFTWEDDAAALA